MQSGADGKLSTHDDLIDVDKDQAAAQSKEVTIAHERVVERWQQPPATNPTASTKPDECVGVGARLPIANRPQRAAWEGETGPPLHHLQSGLLEQEQHQGPPAHAHRREAFPVRDLRESLSPESSSHKAPADPQAHRTRLIGHDRSETWRNEGKRNICDQLKPPKLVQAASN